MKASRKKPFEFRGKSGKQRRESPSNPKQSGLAGLPQEEEAGHKHDAVVHFAGTQVVEHIGNWD